MPISSLLAEKKNSKRIKIHKKSKEEKAQRKYSPAFKKKAKKTNHYWGKNKENTHWP